MDIDNLLQDSDKLRLLPGSKIFLLAAKYNLYFFKETGSPESFDWKDLGLINGRSRLKFSDAPPFLKSIQIFLVFSAKLGRIFIIVV